LRDGREAPEPALAAKRRFGFSAAAGVVLVPVAFAAFG
jgi:hypothetical protein